MSGAKMSGADLISVLKTVALGLFDVFSDFNMVIQFMLAGETNFALISFSIIVTSGVISGLVLGWSLGAEAYKTLHVHGVKAGERSMPEVIKIFQQFGVVVNVTVRERVDAETGEDTSWALVTMSNEEGAQKALEGVSDRMDPDREITVREMIESNADNSTGEMRRLRAQHSSNTLEMVVKTASCSNIIIRYTISIALGIVGLAAAVKATVLVAKMAKMEIEDESKLKSDVVLERGQRDLGWFQLLEMLLETAPQSAVQVFIGVAYGVFEASRPRAVTEPTTIVNGTAIEAPTDTLDATATASLVVSVAVGFISAGATIYAFECRRRNRHLPDELHLKAVSAYGIFTIFGRAVQMGALIFGVSLSACAYQVYAVPVFVASMGSIIYITTEAVNENDVTEGTQHTKPNIAHMLACCVAMITIWGIGVEPVANNYANGDLPTLGLPRCAPIPRIEMDQVMQTAYGSCSSHHPMTGDLLPTNTYSCQPTVGTWRKGSTCQFSCGSPISSECGWSGRDLLSANGANCEQIIELDETCFGFNSTTQKTYNCKNVTTQECYKFEQYSQCSDRSRSVTVFLFLVAVSMVYTGASFIVDPRRSFEEEQFMNDTDFKYNHEKEMEWKKRYAGGDDESTSIDKGLMRKLGQWIPGYAAGRIDSHLEDTENNGVEFQKNWNNPLDEETQSPESSPAPRKMNHADSSNDI